MIGDGCDTLTDGCDMFGDGCGTMIAGRAPDVRRSCASRAKARADYTKLRTVVVHFATVLRRSEPVDH